MTEWGSGKGVGGQDVTAEGGLPEPDLCSPSTAQGRARRGQALNQRSDILGTPGSRLCSRPTVPGLL